MTEVKSWIDSLKNEFPEIKQLPDSSGFAMIWVPEQQWLAMATSLKKSGEYFFDYLVCITAVDYLTHFTLVYHLESTRYGYRLGVKVDTAGREAAAIDSVASLWPSAEFHEREVYDLFGIQFRNHPDLRRLFLEEGWGYPLRKDYRDDNIIER